MRKSRRAHGNGDGNGNSYLCLLPDPHEGQTADEKSGFYWDRHLASDLHRDLFLLSLIFNLLLSFDCRTKATTFVFLDTRFFVWLHLSCVRCMLLGWNPRRARYVDTPLLRNLYMHTKGLWIRPMKVFEKHYHVYDESMNQHGAWTNTFLHMVHISRPNHGYNWRARKATESTWTAWLSGTFFGKSWAVHQTVHKLRSSETWGHVEHSIFCHRHSMLFYECARQKVQHQ